MGRMSFWIEHGNEGNPDSICFGDMEKFYKLNYSNITDIPSEKYKISELDNLILDLLKKGNYNSTNRIFIELHQAGHKVDLRSIRKKLSILKQKNIVSFVNAVEHTALKRQFTRKNIEQ